MRVLLVIALLLFINVICYSQKIEVEFLKEGKKVSLENNFQVYFVFGDSLNRLIMKPKIKGNEFIVPDFLGLEEGHILFEYKNKVYKVGKRGLSFDQNMKWVFGFDKTPFVREYHSNSLKNKNVKGVFYLEFHPLEYGEGVVSATTFKNKKDYLKYGKAIIYE